LCTFYNFYKISVSTLADLMATGRVLPPHSYWDSYWDSYWNSYWCAVQMCRGYDHWNQPAYFSPSNIQRSLQNCEYSASLSVTPNSKLKQSIELAYSMLKLKPATYVQLLFYAQNVSFLCSHQFHKSSIEGIL
jgi:hypothetical protein